MRFRNIIIVLYPMIIAILAFLLFCLTERSPNQAIAGIIRWAEISEAKPLIVHLAQGRTTAISFAVRPEKVVPGNPQALEINFLGKDLTVRPVAPNPGNLIIYTKNNRYVILFQLVSVPAYDDAVTVSSGKPGSRVMKLGTDTYRIRGAIQ